MIYVKRNLFFDLQLKDGIGECYMIHKVMMLFARMIGLLNSYTVVLLFCHIEHLVVNMDPNVCTVCYIILLMTFYISK